MDGGGSEADGAARLVIALCHEVGNLVGAVRLQAHAIDEQLSAVELAAASVEIDDLAARTGMLLALVRPLVAPPTAKGGATDAVMADAVMAGVAEELEAQGGRGVHLEVDTAIGAASVRGQPALLHALLMVLAWHALDRARPRGHVRLHAEESAPDRPGVAFHIEDDGPEEAELLDWARQPPRGRPLACAVAAHVVEALGGRLAVRRRDDRTRLSLFVPAS